MSVLTSNYLNSMTLLPLALATAIGINNVDQTAIMNTNSYYVDFFILWVRRIHADV